VSIIVRGFGARAAQPTSDRSLLGYGKLLDRLDVLLGGRALPQ
jgi:hypothetical protein